MLLEGKSQLDMSRRLELRRETVNRKIGRWVQTSDFEVWLKTAWLDKYRNISDDKAFDALTKLLGKMVTRKAEIKTETKEEITHRTVIKLDPNDRLLLESAARNYIKASNQKESASIH